MRIALFLVYLCSLLLKGDTDLHAGNTNRLPSTVLAADHPPQAPRFISYQSCAVNALPDAVLELKYLLGIDVEDEDSDNFPDTDYRLPSGAAPAPSVPSFLSLSDYRSSFFTATAPIPTREKYLLHRVLRI